MLRDSQFESHQIVRFGALRNAGVLKIGMLMHWSIQISGEIHMDPSLVHTFSWGNSYGPESSSKVSPCTGIGPWMAFPSAAVFAAKMETRMPSCPIQRRAECPSSYVRSRARAWNGAGPTQKNKKHLSRLHNAFDKKRF